MKFFLDNCLPPRLAKALRALDASRNEITHLREKFEPDTPDPKWISALAAEGDWIIVSGDVRIARTPQNREAWRKSGLTAFFLKGKWSRANLWDIAWMLIKQWPRIEKQASMVKRGAGFFIPYGGSKKFEQVKID